MPDQKLKQTQSRWSSITDKVSKISSFVALFISAVTWYSTNAYHKDSLQFMYDYTSHIVIQNIKNDVYEIWPDQLLTFANSGNRPIAITTAAYIFHFPGDRLKPFGLCKEYDDDDQVIDVDFEPLVIKPSEVAFRPVRFKKGDMVQPDGTARVPADINGPYSIWVCLRIKIVTAKEAREVSNINLEGADFSRSGIRERTKTYDRSKSETVYESTDTIFAEYWEWFRSAFTSLQK